MMDSFHRPNERSTKKNRLPPSTKSQTQKISRDGAFNDSEMRLKAILNPTFSNKSQSNPLRQRSTNKRSDSELSRTNQSISYGKENKSQSPKKRSRSKPANNSMIQTNTSKPSLGNTIKTPNHDRSLNSITPSEKRRKIEHNKIPSGTNLNLSGSLHKRTNSSGVGRHSRAFSNERKSSHGLRNVNNISNSVFNNSFAFEDPLNYSREYSYLKEYDTSEFVHLSDLTGLYSSSFKLAGSNDKINNGLSPYNIDNLCSTNNDEEEATVKDPSQNLYRKGKAFFKQKKYPEAAECLKASLQSEGENPEVLFLLGVSYLWLGQYQEAKTELTKLIEKDGTPPKCSVFILLSIVYKKMEDAFSAIKILTKAIMIYPERCDIYIFRAKMYLKLKNWERAISDFRRAAQIDPSRGIAYIGQGDAFRMMAEFDEAVTAYTDAVNLQSPLARIALLKRAIALTELKRYNEAICDLDAIILEDPRHSEAFYFKGLILEKMRDPNEAILCFEQSIKHNTSKKAVTKSLYEITRIKIEEKNFYEAYHTLHRSKMLNLDPNAFRKLTLFTEGVMHLMKKRFDTGVSNLTEVLKYHLAPSLIPMVYSYRAYGNFCSGKIKKALSDYQEVQKLSKLDKTCTYNKLLCEGILAAQADNYDLAQTNFDKALKVYKNKMEPYFYKAVLGIQIFRKSHQKSDKAKLVQVIEAALKLIDKALEINEGCSNLFYVKAVLLYAVEELDLSYSNVQKAVEKADEYYAKYYHLKGAIYAAAGNYYHAISNLSTAISLNKNYRPAYLERAKCYFALCELKQVFLDIQTFTSIKGNDPNIHLWAGNLLFSTGAYEDAARAYSNSENIYKSETLLCLRAKCYLLIKEPSLALKDLTRLVDLQTTSNVHYYIDRECLRSLMIATTPVEASDDLENINVVKAIQTIAKILSYKMSGEIFHLDDLYFYKSVLHFYLQEYEQALDDLDTAWEFRQELNQILKSRKKHNKEEKDHIKIAEEEGAKSSGKKDDGEEDKGYSFTLLEYLYNRGLYLLMDHKYSESCTLFEHLRDQASDPAVKQKAETIIKLIKVQLLKGVKDKDPFNATTKLKTQEFVVFPYMNRLCSLFPSFKLPLSSSTIYETRLSFCFPFVEPPSMAPTINCDILDEITVLSVENRPEAPWIKRSIEGVVFTEDFMQNEEKEITNLKEIIEANGLKEEDVYKSLGGGESKKKLKETHPVESHPTESHQTESAVEEADEIIEYPYEQDPVSKFVPTHELLAHHLSEEKIKMRRSNT